MSYLDRNSDWDHFIATDEMEVFLQVLEQEIHPMLATTKESAVNESKNEPPSSETDLNTNLPRCSLCSFLKTTKSNMHRLGSKEF